MQLFLSLEAQNCTENGLSRILADVQRKLHFLSNLDSLNEKKYGVEFRSISIIPTCVDDRIWNSLGWKERVLIRHKSHEADVRLRMNYEQFVEADEATKKKMFVDVLIRSIHAIQARSRGDFAGEALIEDILMAIESN